MKRKKRYTYMRERERERVRKMGERERVGEREREKEKHFCGTVLFLGIRNFWGRKMDIFWMPHWKLFGSENETEDPETQRPRGPKTQRPKGSGTSISVVQFYAWGLNFLIPKWNFWGQKIKNDPKREFV